jgi:hypothetical protein
MRLIEIGESSLMFGYSEVAKMLATWIRNGSLNEKPRWPTKVFVGESTVSALTAYEYRGYIITVWARPELTHGSTSVGIVYKEDQLGSIIQVQRIEGKLFEREEMAEQYGVDLCKQWVDEQFRLKD